MRTTIDLPVELHRLTSQVARTSGQTLSYTVTALLRTALGESGAATVRTDEETGLRIISVGRQIDDEDVRRLDDEE